MGRLPYYHPPRARPVTFESPSQQQQQQTATTDYHYCDGGGAKTDRAASFLSQNIAARMLDQEQNQGCRMLKTTIEYKHQQNRLANLPAHNSEPKPFVRRSDGVEGGMRIQRATDDQCYDYNQSGGTRLGVHFSNNGNYNQSPVPRVLLNDQPTNAGYCYYPTSTVHKSMLRSSQSRPTSEERTSASRSASPVHHAQQQRRPGELEADAQSRQVRQMSSHRTLAGALGSPQGGATGPANAASINNNNNNCSDENYEQVQRQTLRQQSHHHHQPKPLPSSGEKRWTSPSSSGGSGDCWALGSASVGLGAQTAHQHQQQQQQGKGRVASGLVAPDDRRDEYMWNRQLERSSIAHQTYRTLPIVMPKPKARHDLAAGTYMRFVYDPTWELASAGQSRPASVQLSFSAAAAGKKDHGASRIERAIMGADAGGGYVAAAPAVSALFKPQSLEHQSLFSFSHSMGKA